MPSATARVSQASPTSETEAITEILRAFQPSVWLDWHSEFQSYLGLQAAAQQPNFE